MHPCRLHFTLRVMEIESGRDDQWREHRFSLSVLIEDKECIPETETCRSKRAEISRLLSYREEDQQDIHLL